MLLSFENLRDESFIYEILEEIGFMGKWLNYLVYRIGSDSFQEVKDCTAQPKFLCPPSLHR